MTMPDPIIPDEADRPETDEERLHRLIMEARELQAKLDAKANAEAEPTKNLPAVMEQRAVAKLDATLDVMNSCHAIIDNYGGKTVIASWGPSPTDPDRVVITFQTRGDFSLRYSNRMVGVSVPDQHGGFSTKYMPLGQWWLAHRDRRQYRATTFLPLQPGEVKGCLNLWRGWGVDPIPGDWGLIRDHIVEVVANGDPEAAEYIIRWIAWSIQNPDQQAEVALVLIGEKGAGKGTVGRCLQRIFGLHAFQVSSSEELVGKFNGHLRDCILFIADEAFWGGDKKCIGRLQSMITEPFLTIQPKGLDIFQVPNLLHIIMLAEPGWVIPAGRHERRYAALEVSEARRGDRAYFNALHRHIAEGGAEAMFHDLREMDLGDWHPRELPESLLRGGALQKQQARTLPPAEQWYLGLLHTGMLPYALRSRPNTTLTSSLTADAHGKFPRLKWELTDAALRVFLVDSPERIGIVCEKYRNASANGWSFPPLAECRAEWERIYGPTRWDSPAEEWSALAPQPLKTKLAVVLGDAAGGGNVAPPASPAPAPPRAFIRRRL